MIGFCVYGIISEHETDRLEVFEKTVTAFEVHQIVDAVFPRHQKVPWLEKLQKTSSLRSGRRLNQGEIGAVLSHRKAWKTFLRS